MSKLNISNLLKRGFGFNAGQRQREQLRDRLNPVKPSPISQFNSKQADYHSAELSVAGLSLRYSHRRSTTQSITETPLVLLGGLGCNLEMYESLVAGLGKREVLILEMPGAGKSQSVRGLRRLPFYSKLVAAALDALGMEGLVDVLGVGWGGALAQELARRQPQRVRRLVLAASSSGSSLVPGKVSLLAKLFTPKRFNDEQSFLQLAPVLYAGLLRRKPALLRRVASKVISPSLGGYLKQIYAVCGWSSLPWAHQLSMPSLILGGDDDPLVPLINARILHWFIPRSQLHIVRGGGHLFPYLRSNETASVIDEFLSQQKPFMAWDSIEPSLTELAQAA